MNKELDELPPINDYLPGSMKVEKRQKFEKWYDENRNSAFCLQKALQEYVENDTLILLHAIVAFRNLLKNITKGTIFKTYCILKYYIGYDVLMYNRTIAGLAMSIYKAMHLGDNQIGIVPERGYEKEFKASDIAIKWLEWMAKTTNREIIHAGIGEEWRVGKYRVDGYLIPNEAENKEGKQETIYEFLGCAWHGCQE